MISSIFNRGDVPFERDSIENLANRVGQASNLLEFNLQIE